MTRVLGAVLAGGRSSRFGSDKALALVHGKPLLAHAIESLRQVTQDIVVCGRDWPGEMSLCDRPAADMGPLAGLNAALDHGSAQGFDWVLSLACDTPFLDTAILLNLIECDRAAYVDQHPVIGLWPTRSQGILDGLLGRQERHSLRAFTRLIEAVPLKVQDGIANFNYADDLQQWLAGAEKTK